MASILSHQVIFPIGSNIAAITNRDIITINKVSSAYLIYYIIVPYDNLT